MRDQIASILNILFVAATCFWAGYQKGATDEWRKNHKDSPYV